MARIAPAALVAALLAATAVAFVYTEKLKLTPSPIIGTRVDKVFSPVCDCPTDTAEISFVLRRADRVDVEVIDGDGNVVRELARNQSEPRGRVVFSWDGLDDAGDIVDDLAYRPRVRLRGQHRTIVLPNSIVVDTTPPVIVLLTVRPRVFSPDGDGRRDAVRLRYRADEASSAILLVDGAPRVRKRGRQTQGEIVWTGRVDGRALPEGAYELALTARDAAGNLATPTRARTVVLRYVALGRQVIETRPGARFPVLVLSDARRIGWKVGRLSGVAPPGTLRLPAPQRPGRYTLTVTANGHLARAAVLVRKPPS